MMKFSTLHEVAVNDVTVNRHLELCESLESIIVALANEKQMLMDQIFNLQNITPKKIRHGNKVYVWHCPDELIPEQQL